MPARRALHLADQRHDLRARGQDHDRGVPRAHHLQLRALLRHHRTHCTGQCAVDLRRAARPRRRRHSRRHAGGFCVFGRHHRRGGNAAVRRRARPRSPGDRRRDRELRADRAHLGRLPVLQRHPRLHVGHGLLRRRHADRGRGRHGRLQPAARSRDHAVGLQCRPRRHPVRFAGAHRRHLPVRGDEHLGAGARARPRHCRLLDDRARRVARPAFGLVDREGYGHAAGGCGTPPRPRARPWCR